MRLLLDTQIVYWLFYEQRNVPAVARRLIADADEVLISAVAVWEIAIKVGIGKMNADPGELAQLLETAGFTELPVFARHTVKVANLPMHHGDPFDRLLVAQAVYEQLNLVTTDATLKQYTELVIQA
jgi:PIN domain nuclease of toxin-antitoxin system